MQPLQRHIEFLQQIEKIVKISASLRSPQYGITEHPLRHRLQIVHRHSSRPRPARRTFRRHEIEPLELLRKISPEPRTLSLLPDLFQQPPRANRQHILPATYAASSLLEIRQKEWRPS